MAIMDYNNHLQPDYNAPRKVPSAPTEEEMARDYERYRQERRAQLERQRQASRGGVDRARAYEQAQSEPQMSYEDYAAHAAGYNDLNKIARIDERLTPQNALISHNAAKEIPMDVPVGTQGYQLGNRSLWEPLSAYWVGEDNQGYPVFEDTARHISPQTFEMGRPFRIGYGEAGKNYQQRMSDLQDKYDRYMWVMQNAMD